MARYKDAINWIAYNDDKNIGDEDTGFIVSICMIADLWNRPQAKVAEDVNKLRESIDNTQE